MTEREWREKLKALKAKCKHTLSDSRGGYFRKAPHDVQSKLDEAAREAEDLLGAHLSNKHRLVT